MDVCLLYIIHGGVALHYTWRCVCSTLYMEVCLLYIIHGGVSALHYTWRCSSTLYMEVLVPGGLPGKGFECLIGAGEESRFQINLLE